MKKAKHLIPGIHTRERRTALDMIFREGTKRVNLKRLFAECYNASGMLQAIGACAMAGKKPIQGNDKLDIPDKLFRF